jgi:hypothetical protein
MQIHLGDNQPLMVTMAFAPLSYLFQALKSMIVGLDFFALHFLAFFTICLSLT